MNDVRDAGWKRDIASRVIAVIGVDDDVLDWPDRDLRNRIDQSFGRHRTSLSVRDEDAAIHDDEHVGRREMLAVRVIVLVSVETLSATFTVRGDCRRRRGGQYRDEEAEHAHELPSS